MLLSLLLSSVAWSQQVSAAWIQAPDPNSQVIVRQLSLGFVEEQEGTWLLFHGAPASFDALTERRIPWRPASLHLDASTEGYHDTESMREALEDLAASYPDLTRLVSLGESHEGRPILALEIGTSPSPALQWRILGAHHGDELSSGEMALHTARMLLSSYQSDEQTQDLVDRDRIWVIPHVNPDGVAITSRYNSRSVDLNRNYEYQWSKSEWASGEGPFSELETQSIRTLGDWTGFGAGLSLHSGAANLGWVWNYTTSPAPDRDHLESLAEDFAALCTLDGFWITNGAEWYLTNGDTNDWSYGRHGILDFTLEVSQEKTPPASELDSILSAHFDAVLGFMTDGYTAHGQVLDSSTGLGIPARVIFSEGGSELLTGPEGRFGRPISTGVEEIEVRSPGYRDQTLVLSEPGNLEISLDPESLVEARPTPALLSRGGDGWFSLEMEAQEVVLERPGHPGWPAEEEDGGWRVDPSLLAPGPWSLLIDGQISARSLFIGERDSRVEILEAEWSDETLQVEGAGFASGSKAWAFFGTARSPVGIDLLSEDSTTLVFDTHDLPLDALIDVLVLSHGYQLALLDLDGGGFVDTGEPAPTDTDGTAIDTGSPGGGNSDLPRDMEAGELTACGCSHSTSDFPRRLLVVSLGLLLICWRRST